MNRTAHTFAKSPFQRSFLAQGISLLGGISVLSSGIALAQTPSTDVVIPETSAPSAEVAPPAAAPDPAPVSPEVVPPELSTPTPVVIPERDAVAPPIVQSNPKVTDTYDEPASVVLSERSTGCRSVLQYGQGITNGPCGAPIPQQPPTYAARAASSPSFATQISPLAGSYSGVALGTTPSVRDYYKRTVRPPARLGNGNIRLIFPLSIPASISSAFGWRIHPITGDSRLHSGTDLAAPLGTPVLAAYAGRVAIADFLGGYGLAVAMDHNKGTQQTLYAHLSEIFVKPGEWVEQGMVIGRVGSTGFSTGPHLHFEFRQLTPDGWVAMDAGPQLEYALAQFVKALQTAQATPQTRPKSQS